MNNQDQRKERYYKFNNIPQGVSMKQYCLDNIDKIISNLKTIRKNIVNNIQLKNEDWVSCAEPLESIMPHYVIIGIWRKQMKTKIFNYLLSELYPCPTCDTCQYSDPHFKRVPCDRCDGWDRYKLHKGHEADVNNLVRGIMKIIKANSEKT